MIQTRKLGKKYKVGEEEFWALKEFDVEIAQGETVGLIGSNGGGKSTFLKLLSRVTAPTHGEIHLSGRVGALLEVGTGFHTELTGRENIFLSGAILGMSRKEVKRHFDEILFFSGVGEFLDTPVKKYSSGMLLRIAFAVMAHLQSEILIVDEIFAVGDPEFQKKCTQKMGELVKEGRTVIFVTHQFETIPPFCERMIWIEKGRCVADGKTAEILDKYRCKVDLHEELYSASLS